MHPQLNIELAKSRHEELASRANERHRWLNVRRQPRNPAPAPSWAGLTLRLATAADPVEPAPVLPGI